MTADPLLRVTDLTVTYGTRAVLDSVSITLDEGELVGLLGPNGSGKSTLLRACARLLTPSTGLVELFGQPLERLSSREVAQRLAVLPQAPPVPVGLTVRELVHHGRHPHRRAWTRASRADEDAVGDAIARTGLKSMAQRDVGTLSGGERQRVWMALVLAQATPLVLLDEPTTFLDLGHQWELLELVADLRRSHGLTVMVVLHDINQAARFCDRLVVLDQGRVVAQGEAGEVVTPSLLAETFGVECDVLEQAGRPVALPRRSHARAGPLAGT